MTWAEILSVFNMLAWILPIIIRSYLAWKKPNDSRNILSDKERNSISKSISKLNLRGKVLKIGDGNEEPGRTEGGSK